MDGFMMFAPVRINLEATPYEHEGSQMVLIRDHEGLCEEPLLMPIPMFIVATLLDGSGDVETIRVKFSELTKGQSIEEEQIRIIVDELDTQHLLENDRSRNRRETLQEEWDLLKVRPSSHAGNAYPVCQEECLELFRSYFGGLQNGYDVNAHPRGLIIPHIDYRVGGRSIAKGVATLAPDDPADLYIIFGVAHGPSRNMFTLTDKSFETPLGLADTDTQAAAKLESLYGSDRLDGSMAHKNEHSVEFAVMALQYYHRKNNNYRILPLLTGSLHENMAHESPSPVDRGEVGEFIDALVHLIREHEGRVCMIASVDLSHVGLKFGGENEVDDETAERVRVADDQMLMQIEASDPEGFFNTFRIDQNARNVDAVTAVYVLLHVMNRLNGLNGETGRVQRIDYQQWCETETGSMVTYSSLALY
jgi:AmmeMemoRadiSam system protein B